MGAHIIDGKFQSDKCPTCPAGKVPLSVEDKTAQDLLWTYAQRRRAVDAEFADDLETALRVAGFTPSDLELTKVYDNLTRVQERCTRQEHELRIAKATLDVADCSVQELHCKIDEMDKELSGRRYDPGPRKLAYEALLKAQERLRGLEEMKKP